MRKCEVGRWGVGDGPQASRGLAHMGRTQEESRFERDNKEFACECVGPVIIAAPGAGAWHKVRNLRLAFGRTGQGQRQGRQCDSGHQGSGWNDLERKWAEEKPVETQRVGNAQAGQGREALRKGRRKG